MDQIQNIYIQLLQKYPKLLTLCSLLGALLVLSKLLKTLRFVYRNFIRPRRNLLQRYGEKSWAFITGSSDGSADLIQESEGRSPMLSPSVASTSSSAHAQNQSSSKLKRS